MKGKKKYLSLTTTIAEQEVLVAKTLWFVVKILANMLLKSWSEAQNQLRGIVKYHLSKKIRQLDFSWQRVLA